MSLQHVVENSEFWGPFIKKHGRAYFGGPWKAPEGCGGTAGLATMSILKQRCPHANITRLHIRSYFVHFLPELRLVQRCVEYKRDPVAGKAGSSSLL